jgi:hypothetical protein
MSQVYPAYLPQGAGGGQIISISSGAGTAGWSYTDQQHEWFLEYKIDPMAMGRMCEKFPALAKSWGQFKMLYNLCKSEESDE